MLIELAARKTAYLYLISLIYTKKELTKKSALGKNSPKTILRGFLAALLKRV